MLGPWPIPVPVAGVEKPCRATVAIMPRRAAASIPFHRNRSLLALRARSWKGALSRCQCLVMGEPTHHVLRMRAVLSLPLELRRPRDPSPIFDPFSFRARAGQATARPSGSMALALMRCGFWEGVYEMVEVAYPGRRRFDGRVETTGPAHSSTK